VCAHTRARRQNPNLLSLTVLDCRTTLPVQADTALVTALDAHWKRLRTDPAGIAVLRAHRVRPPAQFTEFVRREQTGDVLVEHIVSGTHTHHVQGGATQDWERRRRHC
jgi:hypothetical protein